METVGLGAGGTTEAGIVVEASTPESEPIKSKQALSNMMLDDRVTQDTCEYSEDRVVGRKRIVKSVDGSIMRNARMNYTYICVHRNRSSTSPSAQHSLQKSSFSSNSWQCSGSMLIMKHEPS
jgi:hypothetical protein